jgi:hypothetical protein
MRAAAGGEGAAGRLSARTHRSLPAAAESMADRSSEFVELVASLSAEAVGKSAATAAASDAKFSSASAASASSQHGASSSRSTVSKAVPDAFSTAARAAFDPVRTALARIATSSATRHAYLAIAAEEAPSSALAAGFGASPTAMFSGASFPTALPSAAAMSDDQRIRFEEVRIRQLSVFLCSFS